MLDRLIEKGEERFLSDAIRAVFPRGDERVLSGEAAASSVRTSDRRKSSRLLAARQLFGLQARYHECATIDAVFEAVSSKDATCMASSVHKLDRRRRQYDLDAPLEGDLVIRQERATPSRTAFSRVRRRWCRSRWSIRTSRRSPSAARGCPSISVRADRPDDCRPLAAAREVIER